MGFFNNIGVTLPTKDNIYSLFCIHNENNYKLGRIRKQKNSTGLRIFIDNEIYHNIKRTTLSESNDYDTEEIVNFLIENHLCIEGIQSISLSVIIEAKHYKKRPYKYRLYGEPSHIYRPGEVLVEIILQNNSSLSLSIRPIEMDNRN